MLEVLIVFADAFEQFSIGHQAKLLGNRPWSRVRHRVVDSDLYFKATDIPSTEALGNMQGLGRRIASLVEPRLSVEAPAFHDQRVAIPLADGEPQP